MIKCPKCGASHRLVNDRCQECDTVFSGEDILEMQRLQYLLEETGSWPGVDETQRAPYRVRLEKLRTRLSKTVPVEPGRIPESVSQLQVQAESPTEAAREKEKAIPKEKVPFDQWLLSERNIKVALYSGGLLLILAGLIFVGANWANIPGPGKFAITLLITGLTYLGGFHLYQRKAFRLGGNALLFVASGFLILNFVVLQIYVLGPQGLHDDLMWVIASSGCLLIYMLTAFSTRSSSFVYLSLAALYVLLISVLVLLNASNEIYILALSFLALILLGLARAVQSTPLVDITSKPFLISAHGTMPLLLLYSFIGMINSRGIVAEFHGIELAAAFLGVLFYATTNIVFKWLEARWVAAALLPFTAMVALVELGFTQIPVSVVLMLVALAYLGLGSVLERIEGNRDGAWPLYVMSFVIAGFVTYFAYYNQIHLAMALIGDVIILSVSAAIFRDYRFIFAAVWLFILPVYLVISLFIDSATIIGVLLGVLGVNYYAAGYALGRKELSLGAPFLTGAAALSVISVLLVWNNPLVAVWVFIAIAGSYLSAALWTGWPALLLPAIAAVNLLTYALSSIFFVGTTFERGFTVAIATLGIIIAMIGRYLERSGQKDWASPLFVFAVADICGAYISGLVLGGWLLIGLSIIFAAILLYSARLISPAYSEVINPQILTYLSLGIIFIGQIYLSVLVAAGDFWIIWPIYAAGLCAAFVLLSQLFKREREQEIYGIPLRRSGLWLMIIPIIFTTMVLWLVPIVLLSVSVGFFSSFTFFYGPFWMKVYESTIVVTCGIAGLTLMADGGLRRSTKLIHLGMVLFVPVIWALLIAQRVYEPQAYYFPLGLMLLGIGWNQHRREKIRSFRILTSSGLLLLIGSMFLQSVWRGNPEYTLWLALEGIAALVWGIRTRIRKYVLYGLFALLAGAVIQVGPAFMDAPRWIQIGITGAVLFGCGMAALFKREQIMEARDKFKKEWRRWES